MLDKRIKNSIWHFDIFIICFVFTLTIFIWYRYLISRNPIGDEVFTFHLASKSLGHLIHESLKDTHPPLYQLILYIWFKLLGYTNSNYHHYPHLLLKGEEEFFRYGRYLSLCFGSLLLLIYLRTKVFDRKIALVAFCLAACSPLLIHFSTQMRSYGLLILFSCISTQEVVKAIRYSTLKNEIIILFSIFLQSSTHLCGVFLSCVQIMLLSKELDSVIISRKQLLKFFLVGLSPFVLWYSISFFYQATGESTLYLHSKTEWIEETIWIQQLFEFFRVIFLAHNARTRVLGFGLVLLCIVLVTKPFKATIKYTELIDSGCERLKNYFSNKEVFCLVKIIIFYIAIFLFILPFKNLIMWRSFSPLAPSVIYLAAISLVSFIRNKLFLCSIFCLVLTYYCFNLPFVVHCCGEKLVR